MAKIDAIIPMVFSCCFSFFCTLFILFYTSK